MVHFRFNEHTLFPESGRRKRFYASGMRLYTYIASEGLSEETVKVAEQVTEQIAMELHNYYLYERGISMYASRLIKLTKLIEAAKVSVILYVGKKI